MDRSFDMVGGAPEFSNPAETASGLAVGELDLENCNAELDNMFRQAGIGVESQFGNSSDDRFDDFELVANDSSFDGYNFQTSLRHATLASSSSLPDLPWESPAWDLAP